MAMMSTEGGSPSFRRSREVESLPDERGDGCILVADDDSDDVYLLRRALRKAGLTPRVLDVFDGTLAVSYLSGEPPFDDRKKYPFPDLFLLDLKMPKMNGFDVLAWLKGRPDMGSLPVIVLSSSSVEDDETMALRMGAREFLTKPADIDNLIPLLRSLHRRWLEHRKMTPETWHSPLAIEQRTIPE
jgi:CheY-like chemotaxis protein